MLHLSWQDAYSVEVTAPDRITVKGKIASEKLIPSRFYRRLPPIIPHIITLIFVFFGFIIFSCEDLSEISERLSGMFFSSSAVSQNSLYLLRSYAFVFLISPPTSNSNN